MKILLVSSLYKPNVGGIETMIHEMASNYISRGHSVIVLTKRWPEALTEKEIIDEVTVYRVFSAKTKAQLEEVGEFFKRYSEDLSCDIIHLIGARRPMPLIVWAFARKKNIPCIVTIAGGEIPHKGDNASYDIWEEGEKTAQPYIPLFDSISACSSSLIGDAELCMPGVPIKLLYAGLDNSYYKQIYPVKWSRPFIVAARRLVYDKGIDLLIDAFNAISGEHEICDLIIIGDGPERADLEKRALNSSCGERIFFLGTQDLNEVISYLKGALFTVVPSRSEGGGLINLEAQSVGCPVVASDCGGIPEYTKPGETALLFSSGDFNDLANKMNQMLKSTSGIRERMAKEGVLFANTFSWDRLIPYYISYYKKTILSYCRNTPKKTISSKELEVFNRGFKKVL